jgi:hypothetical protein
MLCLPFQWSLLSTDYLWEQYVHHFNFFPGFVGRTFFFLHELIDKLKQLVKTGAIEFLIKDLMIVIDFDTKG